MNDATLIITSKPKFAEEQLNPEVNTTIFLYGIEQIKHVLDFKNKFPKVKIYYIGNDLDLYGLKNITQILANNNTKFLNIVADISDKHTQQGFNCAAACLLILINKWIAPKGNAALSMMKPNEIKTNKGRFLYDQLSKGRTAIPDKELYQIVENYTLWFYKPNDPYHDIIPDIKKGGSVGYRIWNFSQKYNKLYEKYTDLEVRTKYDESKYDYPPRCHWGQKKLLLSEIQFLTRIRDSYEPSQVPKFCIVYIGSADGTHMPILYDLFPEFDKWLLYDPSPFNKIVYADGVGVFNMFFTDDTIEHVHKHAGGRRIIFISDIRVTPQEDKIMLDMINQAKWGTELSADFMLLKFRISYDPNIFYELKLPDVLVKDPNIGDLEKGTMIYLDGDVYIQLYPPIHSTEMRLFVQKRPDGKYNLNKYNTVEVEEKLFNYNTVIRGTWNYDYENLNGLDDNIPINSIIAIPGYDNGIENILEYNIIRDYARRNIRSGSNLEIRATELMFDINEELIKSTYRNLEKCNHDMYETYKEASKLWDNIDNVNKNLALLCQRERLETGKVLDPPRIRIALNRIKRQNPKLIFAVL